MSKACIPSRLRRLVAQDARYRCGYCLTTQRIIGRPMVIDHLSPESRGGPTVRENLWLACRRCNEFKGDQTHAIDPLTDVTAPLFNPRTQSWTVHFTWSGDGTDGGHTEPVSTPELLRPWIIWIAVVGAAVAIVFAAPKRRTAGR